MKNSCTQYPTRKVLISVSMMKMVPCLLNNKDRFKKIQRKIMKKAIMNRRKMEKKIMNTTISKC